MLLLLILYNDEPAYNKMRGVVRSYMSALSGKDMAYLFYCYSETIQTDYVIEGDMLYIRGKEAPYPGMPELTTKTMTAIRIVSDLYKFTHIVRPNISTIVDVNELMSYLHYLKNDPAKFSLDYGGGVVSMVQKIDVRGGIIDDKYFGTQFVSGTCFILSDRAVRLLLENKADVDYTIVDDISVGVFFAAHKIRAVWIDRFLWNADSYRPGYIFYRNNREDRDADCLIMSNIVQQIVKSNCTNTAEYADLTAEYHNINVTPEIMRFVDSAGRLKIKRDIRLADLVNEHQYKSNTQIVIRLREIRLTIDDIRPYDIDVQLTR